MTKTLELSQTKELLERALHERGDNWTYPEGWKISADGEDTMCAYFRPNGSPACIVGKIISYLGFSQRDVQEGSSIEDLFKDLKIELDYASIRLLEEVQLSQDTGNNWGLSYRRGLQYVDKISIFDSQMYRNDEYQ